MARYPLYSKRAITLAEHQKIIAAEVNPERKNLYQLCWHLGASQGDVAALIIDAGLPPLNLYPRWVA